MGTVEYLYSPSLSFMDIYVDNLTDGRWNLVDWKLAAKTNIPVILVRSGVDFKPYEFIYKPISGSEFRGFTMEAAPTLVYTQKVYYDLVTSRIGEYI